MDHELSEGDMTQTQTRFFLFLSETKQEFDFVQRVQLHSGFDNLVTVDPNGRSGGLALYYNNEYQIKIL